MCSKNKHFVCCFVLQQSNITRDVASEAIATAHKKAQEKKDQVKGKETENKPSITPSKHKKVETSKDPEDQDAVKNSSPETPKPKRKNMAKTSGTVSQKIPTTPKVSPSGKTKKVKPATSQIVEEELEMKNNIDYGNPESDSSSPDMVAPKWKQQVEKLQEKVKKAEDRQKGLRSINRQALDEEAEVEVQHFKTIKGLDGEIVSLTSNISLTQRRLDVSEAQYGRVKAFVPF
ncbi:hypothetical protein RYX36_037145 [Vicia faba]